MITGNHEDGHATLDGTNDGYIDAFIGDNCLPLSAFNSQSTAGNGYVNFIGSGLCTESTTCYGKEGYFDYPASDPIARIITLTVADTVGNVSSTRVNYKRFRPCRRSEEHTSELQSPDHLVCRLLLEKKKKKQKQQNTLDH